MNKKEFIVMTLIVVIGLLSVLGMCARAEQIDTKKELPVTTQSNSVNFKK